MKSIAAIRTHRWTEAEERLLGQLRAAFGDDVAVVFHNRIEDVRVPADVVDITGKWVAEQGLRTTRDWGWRCGDYFYYALRAAKPGYDHYWLIEPDVLFIGDPVGFFARFADVEADVLGLDPEEMENRAHPFLTTLQHLDPWRAIFALTRMSGEALDRLFALRQENSRSQVGQMRFANDEAFVFSNAMAEPGIEVGNLRDHAPGWFEGAQFDTAPDLLDEALADRPELSDKVLHPVRNKADFKSEIAKRIAGRLQFLEKVSDTWDYLDDADLQDVAGEIQARTLYELRQKKRQRKRLLREQRQRRAAE